MSKNRFEIQKPYITNYNNNIPKQFEPSKAELKHKEKMEEIKNGWIGKFLGGYHNIPRNIAGISAFLLVILLIIELLIFPDCKELPTIIIPIITMCFGYLFGNKNNKQNY